MHCEYALRERFAKRNACRARNTRCTRFARADSRFLARPLRCWRNPAGRRRQDLAAEISTTAAHAPCRQRLSLRAESIAKTALLDPIPAAKDAVRLCVVAMSILKWRVAAPLTQAVRRSRLSNVR